MGPETRLLDDLTKYSETVLMNERNRLLHLELPYFHKERRPKTEVFFTLEVSYTHGLHTIYNLTIISSSLLPAHYPVALSLRPA